MSGARPLTDSEISLILDKGFEGEFSLRNRILFLLRLKTGLRVSEALSIKVSDIVDINGAIVSTLYIQRRYVKGKSSGRSIILHPQVREILRVYLPLLPPNQEFLFKSKKGGIISNKSVWRVEIEAFERCGIDPKRLSTHSTRKTFAEKIHNALGRDIIKTQKALGHKDINSTVQYLSVNQSEIDQAILDI